MSMNAKTRLCLPVRVDPPASILTDRMYASKRNTLARVTFLKSFEKRVEEINGMHYVGPEYT